MLYHQQQKQNMMPFLKLSKEIKFIHQLLESMGVKVPLPIKTRPHVVRTYIINEAVTIKLVKSSEHISDIVTKNQQSSNYHNVQVNLVYTIKEINDEEYEYERKEQEGC